MPRRTSGHIRQPSKWIRDLQIGVGVVGGRGAQKLPQSVASLENAKAAIEEMPLGDTLDNEEPIYALAMMSGDKLTHREAMASPEREL